MQINAASRQHGLSYNQFMSGLVQSNVLLNRKMLAELAVNEPYSFFALTDKIKLALGDSWRDTNRDRLTPEFYDRFVIDDVPPEFLEKPDLEKREEIEFKAIRERFAKGAAKAASTNAEYLKSGKSVKKEAIVKKWKSMGWRKKLDAEKQTASKSE